MSKRTKKSKGPKVDAYQRVTDKVIEIIETEGKLPWECDWVKSRRTIPLNADGRPYNGGNRFWLGLKAMSAGYTSPFWLTKNRILQYITAKETVVDPETGELLQEKGRWKQGCGFRKGEHAMPIVYYNQVRVKDREAAREGRDEDKTIRLIRYSNVWNADQIDGLPERFYPKAEDGELPGGFEPLVEGQRILDTFFGRDGAPKLTHQGDRAYYKPSTDTVNLPEVERFKGDTGEDRARSYYATGFHEVGHATGHKDRLDRESSTGFHFFGDENYSREELVAELTAAFLLGDAGIETPRSLRNSAAYLKSWLKKLKSEPKWIVWAAARAEAACHWIHEGCKPEFKKPDEGESQDNVTVVGFDTPATKSA